MKTKKIDAAKFYSPNEILDLGIVVNTSMQPCRHALYRLLRSNTIKSIKVGSGTTKARYKVLGRELINFTNNR